MNIVYRNAKLVISNGSYNVQQMTTLLSLYSLYGQITPEQYQELMSMIAEQHPNLNTENV